MGHQLSEQGIAIVPSYQEKVTSWPSPRTKQELIHMLGVFGYSNFIPNFAMTTQGFNALRSEIQVDLRPGERLYQAQTALQGEKHQIFSSVQLKQTFHPHHRLHSTNSKSNSIE